MTPAMRASRLLGWVSFAVGAAELLAPKRVARAVGMSEDQALLVRACGLRQVATGVGAHSVYPVPALWARMGGDLADAAILAWLPGARRRARQGPLDRHGGRWRAGGSQRCGGGRLAAETAEGKNEGQRRDYSNRSGFPGGVDAARGAGIVRDAEQGKAGGAAAGDVSRRARRPRAAAAPTWQERRLTRSGRRARPEAVPIARALPAGGRAPGPKRWHHRRWADHASGVAGGRPEPPSYTPV
jgi:hypothetical protein